MKGEDTTFREELRKIETGWVPWVLAAAYFPVYILLDFTAGDLAATRLGLPQSVAVGLVSLTISGVVVLLFVLVNLREAVRRPGHSLGSSRGPLRRGVTSLTAPLAGGFTRLFSSLATAVLVAFVASRDGVAIVLAGIWTVVAEIGGLVYRILSLLTNPVAAAAVVLARPSRAAANRVGGVLGQDPEPLVDELDEPVDRREFEWESPSSSPLRRTDAPSDGGTEDARDVDAVDGRDGDGDTAAVESGVEAAAVESGIEPDRQVVSGDPSGETRADDGEPPTDDSPDDSGEQSVDQPEEDEWPDEWISATDV